MAKPSLADRLAMAVASNTGAHQKAAAKQQSTADLGRQHTSIPLERIARNPFQPRIEFDPTEIEVLARSIAENGLLQPIVVRPLRSEASGTVHPHEEYQIIAGERRFRAHQLLKRPTIDAIITVKADHEVALAALIENLHRADLTDFEVSRGIRSIEESWGEKGISKTKLAEDIGITRSDLYRYYAYDALPAFILARLDVLPSLLSRSAASDIKSALDAATTSGASQADCLAAIKDVWGRLEQEEINQGQMAEAFTKALSKLWTPPSPSPAHDLATPQIEPSPLPKETYSHASGIHWKRSGKNVVFKLPSINLPEGKEAELAALVEDFLSKINA